MIKRKKWRLVILVIVAAGLGYAGYSLFGGGMGDYLTVGELKSGAGSSNDGHVVVEGNVVSGSIEWDSEAKVMRFTLTDGQESLAVTYDGIMPDNFKPGTDLVVAGKYDTDGVFKASSFGKGDAFCGSCHG